MNESIKSDIKGKNTSCREGRVLKLTGSFLIKMKEECKRIISSSSWIR